MKHVLFSLLALGMVFHADVCNAQSFTPTKRVMVEDHTIGQAWSGWWSPRGIVFLDQFMTETPAMGYEVACIHGNAGANMFGYNNFDAMYLAEYSDPALSSSLTNGWPSFILDRKDGASYETETVLPIKYGTISEDFGYANLTISPVFDAASRDLTVTVDAHFAVEADDFRLAVVLTEDSVHKPGVEGYGQTNAYNYCNGDAPDVPMATPTVNFNAFCGPIVPSSFMHFRHVARAIVPSYGGDTESLPSSVEADGQYTYTFPTQTISDDFDETKMRAIALLIDGATGEVVNCLGADFNEPQTSAVGPLAFANFPAKLFPNPAAQTTMLEFNCQRAQLASLDILDALGKIVTQRTIALNPGTNKIDLDVSSLEQGTYMVQVQGDAELHISERLLVSER